ncbi:unnamed protein product [Clonostachys rosea]|uniref:C2H2-type domain-containing protein n=1 Tax=Bionectria ochroleuca TaxID=29856 RepID=A0ABY6V4K3_BIOOC|nr:unnamed protein product [Clonostachys rosea]
MSWLSKTTASGSYIGHKILDDPDLDAKEQLILNELSAKCRANIASLQSQLPDHVPEALQKLENFFIEPCIEFGAMYFQWFNFAPSVYDLSNDLTIIKNMLTGIIELTQRNPCNSSIETLDTEVLDKLKWLRESLLRFLNRVAGHFGCTHRLPEPDSGFIPSQFEGLRNHVKHRILQGKDVANSSNPGLSTLQARLIDAISLRKYRFQRAQAHYKAVMGTSKVEEISQEQSRFKSPIQAGFTLDNLRAMTHIGPVHAVSNQSQKDMCNPHGDGGHFNWECSFCDAGFSDSDDLRFHLHYEHNSQFNVFDDLTPEFHVYRLVLGLRSCPLCTFTAGEDSEELVTHVISHMYEFSSNFLPWIEPSDGVGEATLDCRMDSEVETLTSNAGPNSTVLVEESFSNKDSS